MASSSNSFSFSCSSSSSSSSFASRSFDEKCLLKDSTSYDLITPLLLYERSNNENTQQNRDFSYFHQWMPSSYCYDFFLQGQLCKIWNQMLDQVHHSQEKIIILSTESHSPYLFQLLLKMQPNVKLASIAKNTIRVSLLKIPSYLPPSKQEDYSHNFLHLLPSLESIENVQSKAIRFVSPNCFRASSKYLHKLNEIAKKVEKAIEIKQKNLLIAAAGYDRLFLKKIILQLFPHQVRSVLTESNALLGSLHIGLHKTAHVDQEMLNSLQRIEKALSFLKKEQCPHPFFGEFKITPRSPTRKLSSAPALSMDESLQREFNLEISIFSTFTCFVLQQNLLCIPDVEDFDKWKKISKSTHEISFILRTFGAELQQFVSNDDSLSLKKIRRLAESTDLKKFSSNLENMEESEIALAFNEQLRNRCNYSVIRMHLLYTFEGSAQEKLVKRTAILKHQIESAQMPPLAPLTCDLLSKIEMEQVSRSYYHPHSTKPTISVWVNGIELLPLDSSLAPLEYYKQLIEALYHVSNKQQELLFSDSAALESYEIEKFDGSSYAKDILENRELTALPQIAFMLRTGSFSSWGFADSALRQRIAKPLIAAGYVIKASNPQDYPTCEFYVATNKDFKTILTKTYEIKKNGVKAGEFVVKWNVAMQGNQLSSYITIPMIDLLEIQNDKHETILKMFNIDNHST